MYQVQARVIYPDKNDGWSAPTRDMPTVLFPVASAWEAAAKTVQLLDPFPQDSGITVNMTVMRVVSWYGQDLRAEFDRTIPLEDVVIPVEYFQQKNDGMSQLKSAADFVERKKYKGQ